MTEPCGCPTRGPGVTLTDPEGHAAFHALAVEQGVPPGPVTASTLNTARGMTGDVGSREQNRGKRARDAGRAGWGLTSPQTGSALDGVRPTAPGTSHDLAARLTPLRERTIRLEVFALVAAWTPAVGGLTDDDLERMLDRAHQSVSATRNSLVADGYLTDSGKRRPTRYGNDAILWAPAPGAAIAATHYARRATVRPDGPCLPWDAR